MIREFGITVSLVVSFSRILRIMKCSQRVISNYVNWKNRYVSRWLWNRFSHVVTNCTHVGQKEDGGYVFVFWLQGECEAPPVVRACVSSVKKWCKNRKVVVLDSSNYREYATLPTCLVEKYESGGVNHAHFSDVLRFELLRKHGGIWIDATCFLTKVIPDEALKHSFYSLNGAYSGGLGWKWTSWFMAAKKGDLLVENMCRFYEAYWARYNSAITYLFLDCWLLALYNHFLAIRENIDRLPDCRGQCYGIIGNWNELYEEESFLKIADACFINKLTYKGALPEKQVDGKMTIYGYLLKTY